MVERIRSSISDAFSCARQLRNGSSLTHQSTHSSVVLVLAGFTYMYVHVNVHVHVCTRTHAKGRTSYQHAHVQTNKVTHVHVNVHTLYVCTYMHIVCMQYSTYMYVHVGTCTYCTFFTKVYLHKYIVHVHVYFLHGGLWALQQQLSKNV